MCGDKIQLQQVILSLIMNGGEAMATTAGPKELLVTSQESPDGGVLVAVRDSGIGIKPGEMQRMFDAFFTTKSTGMGMLPGEYADRQSTATSDAP